MGLILVGIISGIVTGLGMGGGSILILILVTFMSVSQHIAQATNLIFFIPTAVIAIIIHIKNNNVEKQVAKKLFFMTIFGSALGAYLTSLVEAENLKRYFGFFLLAVGIYEIITTIKEHLKEKEEEKKWKIG